MERVIVYVDGFNLYFGLRENNWRKYYWLDLNKLSQNLLRSDQMLMQVNYFTARIKDSGHNQADARRQTIYLDALATLPNLITYEGHYLQKTVRCRNCGDTWATYEEKMSDVNLATQLVADAFDNHFDTALIISADSDLSTPVKLVRQRFPQKKLVVALPPARRSHELCRAATGHWVIGEDKLRQSLLPEQITTSSGYVLTRPEYWR